MTILRNAEHNRHRRRRPHLLDNPDHALEQLADMHNSEGNAEHQIVVSQLHRARKRIRQHLARAGVTPTGALS